MAKNRLLLDTKRLLIEAGNCIDRNIETLLPNDRGLCAQNIMAQCRNLTDAFALHYYYLNGGKETGDGQSDLFAAWKSVKALSTFKEIVTFHDSLQIVASHYTQNAFDSELLVSNHLYGLYEVKRHAKQCFGLTLLTKIYKLSCSEKDLAYYESIWKETPPDGAQIVNESYYYIEKKKLIVLDKNALYEYVLSPADDNITKFDRQTVYSKLNIPQHNSIKASLQEHDVLINGSRLPITYVTSFSVSIRPCELNDLFAAIGKPTKVRRSSSGYQPLMAHLTANQLTLFDFLLSPSFDLDLKRLEADSIKQSSKLFESLRDVQSFVEQRQRGYVTLKYLLFTLRHEIMKRQLSRLEDCVIPNTGLKVGCTPFEDHPYWCSLNGHNPSIRNVFSAVPELAKTEELLKQKLRTNTEQEKVLFTPVSDLTQFPFLQALVEAHNRSLSNRLKGDTIEFTQDKKHVFIKSYEEDTVSVLGYLKDRCARPPLKDCRRAIERYLSEATNDGDDPKQNEILKRAFLSGSLLLISGAAGTGKTTLIRRICLACDDKEILFLAQTNSAIQNLRRKVGHNGDGCHYTFLTIEKYLARPFYHSVQFESIVIDECSTISNVDAEKILSKQNFDKLVLTGDERQIESIRFGNWFSFAIKLFKDSHSELEKIHRSQNENLKTIWAEARGNDKKLLDHLVSGNFICRIDETLYQQEEDQVILCLNYDGPFGINNINRLMQQKNGAIGVAWKIWSFKEGDPILFNGNSETRDYFYNNQKGVIEKVQDQGNQILFRVKVPKEESNYRGNIGFIKFLPCGDLSWDHYEITIDKNDEDDEQAIHRIVPFQLAYAITIHKSQGLEYNAVKVIMTDDVSERITHDVFYTAITRAKKKLTIYCEKDSLSKIIRRFSDRRTDVDLSIIKARHPNLLS